MSIGVYSELKNENKSILKPGLDLTVVILILFLYSYGPFYQAKRILGIGAKVRILYIPKIEVHQYFMRQLTKVRM